MTTLRPIEPETHAAILALNNAHAEELSVLDATGLATLLNGAFHARRIGNLAAFIIALDENHHGYDSPNYQWFQARMPRFIYIDRVVVSVDARGQGHARRLYADLMAIARAAGHEFLVCEVNSEPPNPSSDAFHAALGFGQIGTASIHGGAKSVRYFALRLDGGALTAGSMRSPSVSADTTDNQRLR
jgi:predicted GNAT superfamily acetyltransferase